MNGILKKGLNKYKATTNQEWGELLDNLVSTYNSSPIAHFNNLTPFYLVHGYDKTSILEKELEIKRKADRETEIKKVKEKREEIPSLIEKQALINKANYDKNKKSHQFKVNDLVLVRQAKNVARTKFKLEGPFRIKGLLSLSLIHI